MNGDEKRFFPVGLTAPEALRRLTRETYDVIAEDWERDHANDDWWREGADLFLAALPPNGLILDLGCGPGMKSQVFVQRGYRVCGIDSSSEMIRLARARVGMDRATFYELDLVQARYDLFHRTFDGIYAMASLLHIPKQEIPRVLIALRGLLTPTGVLSLCVKATRPGTDGETLVEERDYGTPYTRFFSSFDGPELDALLEASGFVIQWSREREVNQTRWLERLAMRG